MKKSILIVTLILIGIVIAKKMTAEALVPENGKISARALPLDAAASQKAYQTTTFGMG